MRGKSNERGIKKISKRKLLMNLIFKKLLQIGTSICNLNHDKGVKKIMKK